MRKFAPVLILGLVLALAALAVFAVSRGSDYDRSPLGNKGLELWLQTKGIPVVRSDPHVVQARSKISLRIVPLSIRQGEAVTPRSDDETDRLDPENPVVAADQHALPTLIVLPKWRGSVSTDGLASVAGLVDLADIRGELDRIGYSDLGLNRSGKGFEEAHPRLKQDQPISIALYRAQIRSGPPAVLLQGACGHADRCAAHPLREISSSLSAVGSRPIEQPWTGACR